MRFSSDTFKQWARLVKGDALAVYLAARDTRVPWHAKALALLVAAYAFSPIDLIPDFVPVLGYLDDVILVPLGILAVVKLIPPEIIAEHRATAALMSERPVSRKTAFAIVLAWTASIASPSGWATSTSSGSRPDITRAAAAAGTRCRTTRRRP